MKANYDRQQLFLEQVRQLHKHTPIAIAATLLVASALTFVMWNVISPYILVTWFAGIVIITLSRYVFLFKHHHSLTSLVETRRWRNWFVFGIALSGIMWGSTGILLFPADSPLHQFFLATVIVGMLGGGTGTLSVVMSAFLAFSLPLIIPIAMNFLTIGDVVHIAIGCLALIYWILMFFTARHINTSAVKILTLNNSLAEAKDRTEKINTELKAEIEQREKAEKELLVHKEKLEDLVKERTAELSISNQKLLKQIHERKKVAAALQESEKQFRELAELLPMAIYEMDAAGKVTFANRGAFEYFGYTQEDLIQGLNGFDMIAPEDRSKAIQNIQKVLAGEKLGLNEYVALRKDGSTFPALTNSATIFRKGQHVGLRGFIIDITERKQAEEALLKSEEKLARSKRMESLGLMAGGIAHDLNNILSGVTFNGPA
jgi:PAS domain S-box-containing protein